ncbi:MAG: helix-turn-helix transcriptional regulator [Chloroflexi bacterium]|nr:helix-turn-helix transcriptional regulator [Chloroflexota bacterium]
MENDKSMRENEMQNRVKEFREAAGLSQAELARRSHTASPNLSAVERGKREAWPKLRRRLARALKVTEAEIFPEG